MNTFRVLLLIPALAMPLFACEKPAQPEGDVHPVIDILYSQPFVLEESYRHDWRLERPEVRSGAVLVLEVDLELVAPRNAAEPVLYVGDQTAQRLNHGDESGHLIVIVPGDVDLSQAPIWFGRPGLPERVTAETIRSERALANEANIRPFSAQKIKNVTQNRMQAADLAALLREHVADLVLEYSPQERDLAESWRLPVAQP